MTCLQLMSSRTLIVMMLMTARGSAINLEVIPARAAVHRHAEFEQFAALTDGAG